MSNFVRKVNRRAKVYKKFNLNYWIFNHVLLPRLYWAAPLAYMPKRNRLLPLKLYERHFHKTVVYPLFKETSLLIYK